ncbi:MAG: hypothetical protein R3C11_23250 [Planctomycetaceae bacterium]
MLGITGFLTISIEAHAQVGRAQVQQAAANAPQDPRLEAILVKWSAASKKIHRLEGNHRRTHLDHTFRVCDETHGSFIFEAPDRGRMDLELIKIDPENNEKKINRDGEEVVYVRQSGEHKKWISDGKQITEIREDDKTYIQIPVPEELQGANVMNGPLPFLFGLPPEEAHRRFNLKLEKESADEIIINAEPITPVDLQNYKFALVKLDAKSFLPVGVKLFESENSDTTYLFGNFKINQKRFLGGIFQEDPFNPKLDKHKKAQIPLGEEPEKTALEEMPLRKIQQTNGEKEQPNFIGMHFEQAKELAIKMGYEPSFVAGKTIENPKLQYTVYGIQIVPPKEQQDKKILRMTLYDDPDRKKK